MQVAANRSAASKGAPEAPLDGSSNSRIGADGTALLGALPIAAAIVGQTSKGILKLIAHNERFDDVIARSGDQDMINGDFRRCVHLHIAQLMTEFLADAGGASELDFCDGEGISARYFRIKLAPLPRDEMRGRPRCLVCLVDRTVEVRASARSAPRCSVTA